MSEKEFYIYCIPRLFKLKLFRNWFSYFENENIQLFYRKKEFFKKNSALTALLLQGLIHSRNRVKYHREIETLVNMLIDQQDNTNGYYYETHTNYHQPSALVTSLVGISLIEISQLNNGNINNSVKQCIEKIKSFLINQEIKPGCYRKSFGFPSLILNANASITLFFALYSFYIDKNCLYEKVQDFINSIPDYMQKDGALTYGILGQDYFVPSVYYHALSLIFLIRIQNIVNSKKLEKLIEIAQKWIKKSWSGEGIKWHRSGLPFSVYLNQAHAFIYYCLKDWNLKEKEDIAGFIMKGYETGLMFRLSKQDNVIKRIRTGINVGIKSRNSLVKKFISIILLTNYLVLVKFNVNRKPRNYRPNPIFRFLRIKSRVSPPNNNSYDIMATIESFSYFTLALSEKPFIK